MEVPPDTNVPIDERPKLKPDSDDDDEPRLREKLKKAIRERMHKHFLNEALNHR